MISIVTAAITTALTVNELDDSINGSEDLRHKRVPALRGSTINGFLADEGQNQPRAAISLPMHSRLIHPPLCPFPPSRCFAMPSRTFMSVIAAALLSSGTVRAELAGGLNVVVTSADRQVQMMAMVLSVQTMTTHEKPVYLAFCGAAGDLALKATRTDPFAPANKSPSMLLRTLIDNGAVVQVCPLYLPSVGKTPADLIPGIDVAQPADMAGRLLDRALQNLSF